MRPLWERQGRALKRYQQELVRYDGEKEQFDAELAEWKRKGRKNGDPPPQPPEPPVCERVLVSDATVEALADRLRENPRGVLLSVDELAGWLLAFNQYKGGRGADAAHWLTIFGARSLLVDRKTGDRRTIYVPRAAVSVCGTIQPKTLRRVLTAEHVDNGLAARLLLAMPPVRAKRWTDAELTDADREQLAGVFDGLLALPAGEIDQGEIEPLVVKLTRTAKTVWVEFFNEHAIDTAEADDALAAAFSKLEGYAARLALLVHCVRVVTGNAEPLQMDEFSIRAGIALSRWFTNEARRVYAMLSGDEEALRAANLAERARTMGGSVSERDWARSRSLIASDAEAELNDLVKRGIGRWEHVPPGEKGGRAKRLFVLADGSDTDTTPANPDENAGSVNVSGDGQDQSALRELVI